MGFNQSVWGMWAESTKPSDVTSSLILLLLLLTLARLSYTTHISFVNTCTCIYKRQCFIHRTIFITCHVPWESEIDDGGIMLCALCLSAKTWKLGSEFLKEQFDCKFSFKRNLHSSVSLWLINTGIEIINHYWLVWQCI